MKHILKIIRISAKKWFKLLKEKAPYKCNELNKNIEITNIFKKHISWYQKQRTTKEIIIRLWMINLIDDILKEWKIIQKRKNGKYEWKIYDFTYRIWLNISWIDFITVIWETKSKKYILLSCFSKNLQIKKDYPV
jgi:hypothetical protein